jgi:hypothetical protein
MANKKKASLISQLETKIDFLETELSYINNLLLECGFSHGTETLKETAKELLEEMHASKDLNDD